MKLVLEAASGIHQSLYSAMCAAVKDVIGKRLPSTRGRYACLTGIIQRQIVEHEKRQLVLTIKIHCVEHD